MSEPIDDMVESLKAFVECKHTYWECTQCHCRTNAGTVASPWRTKVNELEAEVERLKVERDDAREAAKFLNQAIVAMPMYDRDADRANEEALERWPWLAEKGGAE